MGMSDCLWGLLDGVNGDGLCASLTFGGRRIVGVGFGIPHCTPLLPRNLQQHSGSDSKTSVGSGAHGIQCDAY